MGTNTVNFTWKVGGVLTDPTSVVLADPTAAYGVKRNDTGGVVVAAGTALTKVATGTYTYAFTDPAYDLTYTRYIKVVYGGNTTYIPATIAGAVTPSTAGGIGLTWSDVYGAVCNYLYDPLDNNGNARTFTAAQIAQAKVVALFGMNDYYSFREWSFLKPRGTLAVPASALTTDLPADFRSNCYDFHWNTTAFRMTEITMEKLIQSRVALNNATGVPYWYATAPKAFTASTGQRFEVCFYPVPQADMSLQYQYTINPAAPSADTDYLYGGALHQLTALYAALAHAETTSGRADGPMNNKYNGPNNPQSLLMRSLERDMEVGDMNLGYNGDEMPTNDYSMWINAMRQQPVAYG